MNAAPLLLLAALAFSQIQGTPEECPAGSERIPTGNTLEPFHCKPFGSGQPPVLQMTPNFLKPHCPKGFEPEQSPGEKFRYRCIPVKRQDAEPELAPVLETTAPAKQKKKEAPTNFTAPVEYLRYTIKDQLQFDYPKDWKMINGWQDEVPTLYIEFDTGRQGKQVTVVVSKLTPVEPGYEDMDAAIEHEKEYQNAADAGSGRIAGFPARVTALANSSKTAYVRLGADDYLTLSYSAPEDLYKTFEPVYKRLLQSFKIAKTFKGVP